MKLIFYRQFDIYEKMQKRDFTFYFKSEGNIIKFS